MVAARTTTGLWVGNTDTAMTVNWNPSFIEEIHQNVRTILSVYKGEVMLDRTFGIDPNIIDQPMNVALQRIKSDIVREVEHQEPRVKVQYVQAVNNGAASAASGTLALRVYIRIKDEFLS